MPVRTEVVSPPEIAALLDDLRAIYGRAFSGPPHFETEADVDRFIDRFGRHRERPGFRCYVARIGDQLVGFGYGYTSRPGQWWHDLIARALEGDAGWLEGAFELVTLAVDPGVQGQGIGRQIHDALLHGLPHSTAVLSVRDIEAPALRLYRSRGWREVISPFFYPGGNSPFVIMRHDLT